jgi:hypothetical protein
VDKLNPAQQDVIAELDLGILKSEVGARAYGANWVVKAGAESNGKGIAVDSSGNAYVTGYFQGTATFGSTSLTSSGSGDIFIAKLSTSGSWQWAVKAGGSSSGIAVDSSGNAYITGFFQGTESFGSTSLSTSGDYDSDIFIAKLSSSGSWQWAVKAGGSSGDGGNGIAVDSSGNAYVTGTFSGNHVDFGNDEVNSDGGTDIFVAKLSTSGSWQWVVEAGSSNNDAGLGIAVDSSGNAYVTGYFQGTAKFNGNLVSSGGNDIFIAKLSSSGSWQWVVKAGGSSGEYGTAIAVDSSGNAYVTGFFQGTATFGSTSLTSSGGLDIFIAKLSSSGSWQWAVKAGGSSGDSGNGIAVDSSGNAYVTGYFQGTATFGSTSQTSSGALDIFIAKLSSSGSWQWAVKAGDSNNDNGKGIAVDSSGNAYVTGYFKGTATFGSTSHTSSGSQDIFIAKLDGADTDNDLVPSGWDNCLNIANSNQTDNDWDLDGDVCDDDDDNDTVLDVDDDCSTGLAPPIDPLPFWISNASTDHDGDGCKDYHFPNDPPAWEQDTDDDNDGINDTNDDCPTGDLNWVVSNLTDHDDDGCQDSLEDTDDDNDGFSDGNDSCPKGLIPAEVYDAEGQNWWEPGADDDSDGCHNYYEDDDDDNDGMNDTSDMCDGWEYNTNHWISNSSTDYDSDGCMDDSGEDEDDDNDWISDIDDDCPKGDLGWYSNRTGAGSRWPADWDQANSTDWDRDGCQDAVEDLDDDNDGVNDSVDLCSRGYTGHYWEDWDSDENSDPDNDDDGCHDYVGTADNSTIFGTSLGEDMDDDNDLHLDHQDTCRTLAGTSNLILEDGPITVYYPNGEYKMIQVDQIGCPDEDGDDWPEYGIAIRGGGEGDGGGNPDGGVNYVQIDMFNNDSTQWWDTDGDGKGDNFADAEAIRESYWPGWLVEGADNSDSSPLDLDDDGFQDFNLLRSFGLIDSSIYIEQDIIGEAPVQLWDMCREDSGSAMWGWQAGEIYGWKVYSGGCIDSDGDLYMDSKDWDVEDASQWADTDSDGFGDNEDGFEGDGCPNTWGDSWRDRHGCVDGDRDGQSDFGDVFDKNGTQWQDTDGDGFGDNWGDSSWNQSRASNWPGEYVAGAFKPDPSPLDYDNDGFSDSAFGGDGPFDDCVLMYGTSDVDQYGCPDADGDGWSDLGDLVPTDPTQWADSDGDGFGDNPSGMMSDSCPEVSGNSTRDAFGCPDEDGDGWSSAFDFDDQSANVWSDLDGDGFPDQPGFFNSDDCINQAGTSTMPWKGCADIDGDGTMDIADMDADGDGISNALELQAGGALKTAFDIYDASSKPSDLDGDGLPDVLDADSDGDGYPDSVEKERGSDPGDANETPMNLYGDSEIGIFYVPGEGFSSQYSENGYELSLSFLVSMLTSEYLFALLLLPASLLLVLRKRRRYKRFSKRLKSAESMDDLAGAEEEIDRLITKRKLKIDQALLLRNQFERLSASFSGEGPPMLSQNRQGDSQPRASMNQDGHQSDWEQNVGWQNEQRGSGGGGPPERNW